MPVKYPPMELRELHTREGSGTSVPRPRTREIPAHGTGGFNPCIDAVSLFLQKGTYYNGSLSRSFGRRVPYSIVYFTESDKKYFNIL